MVKAFIGHPKEPLHRLGPKRPSIIAYYFQAYRPTLDEHRFWIRG